MAERANIFGAADLDLSDFKPAAPPPQPPREAVRKVAEKASFSSREPEKSGLHASRAFTAQGGAPSSRSKQTRT